MPGGGAASGWVAVVGVALTAVYGTQLLPALNGVLPLVIGIASVVALVVGIRWNRPEDLRPWLAVAGAALAFLAGIGLRPWAVGRSVPEVLLPDVCTITGYLLVVTALVLWLRGRGGFDRHALTDGVIVCLGAGLLAAEFLALPAARIGERSAVVSVLAGLYPLWDVVVLLLSLNLGFSTAARLSSFRYLVASVVALFVGDLGYAWIGRTGDLTGPPILDLPFLLAFVALAAAALHPGMVEMSDSTARPVQPWSAPRLALIVPALAAPVVVLAFGSGRRAALLLTAVVAAALSAALMVRALAAVRSHSEIQRGLRHQATHDPLTGLPNRIWFCDRVNHLLRDGRTPQDDVWVLFVDLDGFKLVNDHWGHEVGDVVLVGVSRRIAALTRDDQLLARISGDEFVLAGTGGADEAVALADRIRADLLFPLEVAGIDLVVNGSTGIVVTGDQRSAESLLRDADLAMYRSKAEGRNRWTMFDAALRQEVRERVETELALRQAVSRGQLWVAFQPVVDCRTSGIVGAEALLRWTHPIRGPIAPVDFVPVAEETGLIDEIGLFVLDEALAQVARWDEEELLPDGFHISVNVSARQLRDGRLRTAVRDLLARYRLPGSRLVLEITESMMMGDPDAVGDVLDEIRALGVGLAVDDFGTGYSSLSELSRYPVTSVKVDRAFVAGLGTDAGGDAIARAVTALARALRLEVVAEGVETPAQRAALIALGVKHAQGWLWAPAEAHDVFAERHLRGEIVHVGVS